MVSILKLYRHPFVSFAWKVLIALEERDVPFKFLMVDPEHPENVQAVARLAPTGQFPLLIDGDRTVIQFAAVIEYLDLRHGTAPPMVPADTRIAIEARQMDSVFDDYVMAPVTRMVLNALSEDNSRDPLATPKATATLDRTYAWLERWMTGRTWAANETFSLADCSAAPALFYTHWAHPILEGHAALRAYRVRLLARPCVARVIARLGGRSSR